MRLETFTPHPATAPQPPLDGPRMAVGRRSGAARPTTAIPPRAPTIAPDFRPILQPQMRI